MRVPCQAALLRVPDAVPKATLGHRAVALCAWLHYGLGVTIDQVVDVLGYHLHTALSRGGLVAAWQRLASQEHTGKQTCRWHPPRDDQ